MPTTKPSDDPRWGRPGGPSLSGGLGGRHSASGEPLSTWPLPAHSRTTTQESRGWRSRTRDGGVEFLQALVPLLADGGVCHWYDFATDWELPACKRTCNILNTECMTLGLSCKVLRVAAANRRTIAERQYRVVADFQVSKSWCRDEWHRMKVMKADVSVSCVRMGRPRTYGLCGTFRVFQSL